MRRRTPPHAQIWTRQRALHTGGAWEGEGGDGKQKKMLGGAKIDSAKIDSVCINCVMAKLKNKQNNMRIDMPCPL